MIRDYGGWMTAKRLERLPLILRSLRSYPPPGINHTEARRTLWRKCGGPLDDVPTLLNVLSECRLIEARESWLRLTKEGVKVATQDHQSGGRLLALSLIRSGLFADQVRRLIEVSVVDKSNALTCSRDVAQSVATQLVGVLRRFSSVSFDDDLKLPPEIVAELTDVWSLLPLPAVANTDQRKNLGNRGELYSYRFCRLGAADSSKVHWVARDDDSLGYDIEDLNGESQRRIEVKASTETTVRFFLSLNEWEMAHRFGDEYEIHFWGGVSLSRPVREEYLRLVTRGFPIVFRGIDELLESGALFARPTQYVVTNVPFL